MLPEKAGLIPSNKTWPPYSNFRFNFTMSSPVLSAVLGNKLLISILSTGALQIVPVIFSICPGDNTVIFLNNIRFTIKALSSFRILWNSVGKSNTSRLFDTDDKVFHIFDISYYKFQKYKLNYQTTLCKTMVIFLNYIYSDQILPLIFYISNNGTQHIKRTAHLWYAP